MQKKDDEAESLYKRALEIREKSLEPNHKDIGITSNSLAELYARRKQYALAEPLFARSLAIREKTLGPDHLDVSAALNSLAETYMAQNQFDPVEHDFVSR